MASDLNTIFARARTIATQTGGDANASPLIDDLANAKALLNHVIRNVWRKKAADASGYHDIATKQTIAVAASAGTLPTNVMREFLGTNAQFQDTNNSLITFLDYVIDANTSTLYSQLGYVTLNGTALTYRAPAPNQSYTGSLYLTCPTMPTIPSTWASTLDVSDTATDDIVLALSMAMAGTYSFDGISPNDVADGK